MDAKNWEPSLENSVEATVLELVESYGEVEVAVVFRAVVCRFGEHAVPHIVPAITRALERHDLKMDARLAATHDPAIPILLRHRA